MLARERNRFRGVAFTPGTAGRGGKDRSVSLELMGSFILHVFGKKDVILKIFTLAMDKGWGGRKSWSGSNSGIGAQFIKKKNYYFLIGSGQYSWKFMHVQDVEVWGSVTSLACCLEVDSERQHPFRYVNSVSLAGLQLFPGSLLFVSFSHSLAHCHVIWGISEFFSCHTPRSPG